MSDETIRILHQGDPSDTRFQFEVIKSLADSIRSMGDTQTRILERLARIEEHRVHEAVGKLTARIDVLEQDKDRRDGAMSLLGGIKSWWPVIIGLASLFSALWLAGRSVGLVPAPPIKDSLPAIVHPAPGDRRDNK